MKVPTRNIDWSLLSTFLAVLDSGSLLAACATTGLSQPTVGRRVAELEQQLGISLFERSGRGLQPTQAAGKIAPWAREMEEAASNMLLNLEKTSSQVVGTVRLSTTPTIAAYCMPQLLTELRLTHPQIQIELVATAEQSNLLKREADIAIRMFRPSQNSLITKKLGELPFGVFAHTRYLALHGTPETPLQLLDHVVIGFDNHDFIISGFKAQDLIVDPSRFAVRTDDFIAYWQLVRSGLGIGFLAEHVAALDPKVVRLLPNMQLPALPVWLTTHRELKDNTHIRCVFDFLSQRFMSSV